MASPNLNALPNAAADVGQPIYQLVAAGGKNVRILNEYAANAEADNDALQSKVLTGRARQQQLSQQIHDLRLQQPDRTRLTELLEARRLYHISTILARAELLCRSEPSLSQYSGDEARFDDLTILERAKGFLDLEGHDSADRDDALREADNRLAVAELAIEKAPY